MTFYEIISAFGTDHVVSTLLFSIMVVIALWEGVKKVIAIFNALYQKKKDSETATKNMEELKANDTAQNKDLAILIGAVKVQMRHSIVRIAEESLKHGSIGSYELQSLEELFNTYCNDLHGNSYVHNLMKKVRELPIDYTNGNPNE